MATRDPRIAAAALQAAEHFNGRDGFDNGGRKNLYQCEADASHLIVTVDREPGVTPFTVQCPHCEAAGTPGSGFYRHPAMQSVMYRVHPGVIPTHEWYRPDTLAGLSAGVADHVLRGGLVLRKIEDPESERPRPGPLGAAVAAARAANPPTMERLAELRRAAEDKGGKRAARRNRAKGRG